MIPTIEIDLDETTSIDEVINLFVDISQQGVKVKRFEVVRALGKDKLFNQILKLIAIIQERQRSKFYRAKTQSAFVFVLKQLIGISRIADNNSQVERMWERLTEIAMFLRTGVHRRPAEVLDGFIRHQNANAPLNVAELGRLRRAFEFLRDAYKRYPAMRDGKLASDQPQFYTLIRTMLSDNLIDKFGDQKLARKLAAVSETISSGSTSAATKKYNDLSSRSTADPSRRKERGALLLKMIEAA